MNTCVDIARIGSQGREAISGSLHYHVPMPVAAFASGNKGAAPGPKTRGGRATALCAAGIPATPYTSRWYECGHRVGRGKELLSAECAHSGKITGWLLATRQELSVPHLHRS